MGDYLVDHEKVSMIAFTGSMEVGLRIIERAGKTHSNQPSVKTVIAEMGGKNAIVIDDDADLDEAVPAVLDSAFTYQGRLIDTNVPGDGFYDLQCKLFDSRDPCASQVGPTLTFENGQPTDGYFTIHLDFGVEVFDPCFRPRWRSGQ